MKLKKYLSRSMLFFYILMFPQCATSSVVKKICGEYLFEVKIENESNFGGKKIELFYQKKEHEKKMFYKTDYVYSMRIVCIKNKNKDNLLLFSEFYGGNGGPEEVYGIFDLRLKKMLIKPADNEYKDNFEATHKILGFPPPRISTNSESNYFFCCGQNRRIH